MSFVLKHLSGLPGLLLVVLVLLAYIALALVPFKWVPPRRLVNTVAAGTDGLRFPATGLARTREAPGWLKRAAELGQLRLELRFRAYAPEQRGPARIFTISRDLHLRNLTVDQNGSDLVLWLRRPGSTLNGIPTYRLRGVLGHAGWHEIEIAIAPGSLRIAVDGIIAFTGALPERPLADWDRRYLVALGNELNGIRPWRGEVARAVVEVGGERVDYVRPGVLEAPGKFWAFANRATWGFEDYSHPLSTKDWIGNFVAFIPLGFFLNALGGKRGSWRKAVTVCALASLLVEVGQVVFSRHPSAVDFVLNSLGGAAGAGIARWLIGQAQKNTPSAPGARV